MSLRTMHLLFILLVIVGADLFGGWAIWHARHGGPGSLWALGALSIVGGFGLIVYAFRLVRGLERSEQH